jgi:hypothetical protein
MARAYPRRAEMNLRPLIRHCSAVLALLLLPSISLALPNGTIVGASVNCRASPPRFDTTSIFTLTLKPGKVLQVLAPGARVEAVEKLTLGDGDDWYRVLPASGAGCWLFGGSRSGPRYLQLDPGARVSHLDRSLMVVGVVGWSPIPNAQAQPVAPDVAREPAVKISPLQAAMVAAVYVALFVASLGLIKRFAFPNSPSHLLASGLGVLLILGVLSETAFASIFTTLFGK